MIAALMLAAAIQEPVTLALPNPRPRVLVFSKTAGFRHDSIPNGIQMIQELGAQMGFGVGATEDAAAFTQGLAGADVVVFLSTTGDVLNEDQQRAFSRFIVSGGGYVGIHAAADTEYDWPFYGSVVGAYFKSHPAIQKAKVKVEDRTHCTTCFLNAEWERTDEWYTYRANPRGNVNVLASLDESTYQGGGMGDHPITWWQEVGQGRAWYTGFGHTKETYTEPDFRRMIGEAIVWSAQGKKPEGAEELTWASTDGWVHIMHEGVSNPHTSIENKPGANKHLVSSNEFGDGLYHVEFKIPKGSNSGVYLMGRYELQIFDSSGKSKEQMTFADCGGIYQRFGKDRAYEGHAPLRNAFAGPDRWNAYDILLRAPRFKNGKKTEDALFLEVRLNGVVIHKNVRQSGPTGAPLFEEEGSAGPILFQGDHGPVAFRNVWVKRLGG